MRVDREIQRHRQSGDLTGGGEITGSLSAALSGI